MKPLGDYKLTIVTPENFTECIDEINAFPDFSIDLETTGLNSFKDDFLFSFAICHEEKVFYFNFNNIPDDTGALAPVILPHQFITKIFEGLDKPGLYLYAHNAKFDLHFLGREGVKFNEANLYCTEVAARLVHNQLMNYKLETLAEKIGFKKDDAVKDYLKKNKLGYRFNLVPFEIMAKYCAHDAYVTYKLAKYTRKRLEEHSEEQINLGLPDIMQVVDEEIKTTRTLLEMENTGILLNVDYCTRAFNYQCEAYRMAAEKFTNFTGIEFQDAPTVLAAAFKKFGISPGKTAKGNNSFKEDILPDHVISEFILEYRKAYKLAHTYYENFLNLRDNNNVIHCNFRQSGTLTGRLSASNPNLQNVPKRNEDNQEFKVRACFIPRPDYFFLMLDYDQMEYRLLLDCCEEKELINKIIGGLDVHTATAESMGVDRHAAKTLNFLLLYGGGAGKLAAALGVLLSEAKQKKALYFRTLTKVKDFVGQLASTVDKRGFVINWYGRRILNAPQGSYAIANHYIQGGCADIVKIAMNRLFNFLKNKKSRMILQVHDEILYEIHKSEAAIIPELLNIMRDAYTHKLLPLTAGADYSFNNWYEKKELPITLLIIGMKKRNYQNV